MKSRYNSLIAVLFCSFFIVGTIKSVQEIAVIQKTKTRNDILKNCYESRLSVTFISDFLENIDSIVLLPTTTGGLYSLNFTKAICTEDRQLIYKIKQKIDSIVGTNPHLLQAILREVGEPLPPLDCNLVRNPLTLEEAIQQLPLSLQRRVFSWEDFSEYCCNFFYRIQVYKVATTCEQIYLKQRVVRTWYILNRIIRAFAAEEDEEPEINTYFRSLLSIQFQQRGGCGEIVKNRLNHGTDTILMFALSPIENKPDDVFMAENGLRSDLD